MNPVYYNSGTHFWVAIHRLRNPGLQPAAETDASVKTLHTSVLRVEPSQAAAFLEYCVGAHRGTKGGDGKGFLLQF